VSDEFEAYQRAQAWSSPDQVSPARVSEAYNAAKQYAQQLASNLPSREQVVGHVQQHLHRRIDEIATTPSAAEVADRYSLPGGIGPASVPGVVAGTATSGMQMALSLADRVGSALGMTQPGQIQQRFAEAGHRAVDNAVASAPRIAANAREAVQHSWNPFTGVRLAAEARMRRDAEILVAGRDIHQTPVVNRLPGTRPEE
jgi:hypothetical protein